MWWDEDEDALGAYYVPGKEDYFDKVSDIFGYLTSAKAWDNFIQYQLRPSALNEAFEADVIDVSPKDFLDGITYDHSYRASKIEANLT